MVKQDLSDNDYDGISYLTENGEEDIKISHALNTTSRLVGCFVYLIKMKD